MLSDYEFNKYLYAHLDIEALKQQYERERAEAYENVSPTMTFFDYEAGKVVSGSVSVEDHAVYLAEIYERFQKRKREVLNRVELLEEAVSLLYDDERAHFEEWKRDSMGISPKVVGTLKECLEYVLEGASNLQCYENEMSIEEWDAAVDEMTEEELLQDYWDYDDTFDTAILKYREIQKNYGRIRNVEQEVQTKT